MHQNVSRCLLHGILSLLDFHGTAIEYSVGTVKFSPLLSTVDMVARCVEPKHSDLPSICSLTSKIMINHGREHACLLGW